MSRERDNYENSGWRRFERGMEGETDPLQGRVEVKRPGQETKKVAQIPIDYQKIEEAVYNTDKNLNMKFFRVFYKVMSAILCFGIIAVLLWTVSYLPVKPQQQRGARPLHRVGPSGDRRGQCGHGHDPGLPGVRHLRRVLRPVHRLLLCAHTFKNRSGEQQRAVKAASGGRGRPLL